MKWTNYKKKSITKTYLNKFDYLKLPFYIVKLGFTGVYLIFSPWRFYRVPTICFEQKYEKISDFFFYLKIVQFLEVKYSIYLNRRVFVMISE